MFIEQLQSERKDFVERLVGFSRKVGELETTLKHLISPRTQKNARQTACCLPSNFQRYLETEHLMRLAKARARKLLAHGQ